MNGNADTARALYLELRALGLKLWVEDAPDGGPLDYGIALDGLRSLSEARARRLARTAVVVHPPGPGLAPARAASARRWPAPDHGSGAQGRQRTALPVT